MPPGSCSARRPTYGNAPDRKLAPRPAHREARPRSIETPTIVPLSGKGPHVVRDQLVHFGITINGLTILNEFPTLNRYFERYIIGGYGSFVMVAKDYDDFRRAIYRKLLKEITGPRLT